MRNKNTGAILAGLIILGFVGFAVWKEAKSKETYSATDIARWKALVAKLQSGDRSIITPALEEESKRIKTDIRTRLISKPASITSRDIQMLKLLN